MATALLNGDVELEVARAYSGIIRSIAQMKAAEVAKARYLRTRPDLRIDWDVEGQDGE